VTRLGAVNGLRAQAGAQRRGIRDCPSCRGAPSPRQGANAVAREALVAEIDFS